MCPLQTLRNIHLNVITNILIKLQPMSTKDDRKKDKERKGGKKKTKVHVKV